MELVRIKIKSPSVSVADLELTCSSHQTVLSLKQRIEAEYPTHPRTCNQKLVYSGKLLQDNMVLQHFLRFEDECSVFTVHLVCQVDECKQLPAAPTRSSSTDQPVPEHLAVSSPGPASPDQQSLDEVRLLLQGVLQQDGGQAQLTSLTAEQLAQYQELYNQYINLYTQYMHSQPHQQTAQAAPPDHPQPPAAADQPLPGAAEQGPAAAIDEAAGNNDILDYAYAIIRVVILFCIMYVHSSFSRLLFVAVGIALVYILQNRNRRGEINNNNNINNNNREGEEPLLERVENSGETLAREQKPNIFMVAVTFVTTLFSSIIPQPNQLV